jgi:hypothetical protein
MDHPFIRLVLYSIAVIHVVFGSVMIMMYSKKAIAGALLAYFRFMVFDIAVINIAMLIARQLGSETVELHLMHMIMMNQLQMAAMDVISARMVLHIVLGFIGEFLFWYVLVYRSMKNKKYN